MIHLFFLNKNSLGNRYKKCHDDISNICNRSGLQYEVFATESISELTYKVALHKNQEDTVHYAVGGDGTFQALVNSLDLEKSVLQYLPFGSGNNAYVTFYNREFDLERDILSTGTFTADLGQANGKYFTTMFGLALDASVGHNLRRFKRLPLSGKGKYYASILYTFIFDSKPVSVRMNVDGFEKDRVSSFISITNGPTTGGQTPISPHSNAFDGKLNAIIGEEMTFLKSLKMFSKVKTGEHLKEPGLMQLLFEKMTFESDDTLMYEIDGEIHYANRIEINVCKDAITLKG